MEKIKINSTVALHYDQLMEVIQDTCWEDENKTNQALQEIIKIMDHLYEAGCKIPSKTFNPN